MDWQVENVQAPNHGGVDALRPNIKYLNLENMNYWY